MPAVAALIRPSLAVFVANPFGLTLGPVGDRAAHQTVLRVVLEQAWADHPAGSIVPSGIRWTVDDLRTLQLRKQAH